MLNITEYKSCEKVFRYFEKISEIPRISGNTEKIADFLVEFAKAHRLFHIRDERDNVIIKKPATEGYENHPTVIIQGHTDMVADKAPDCRLNLDKDGLEIFRDGDFIKARGTTLGADDGIAVAYALAILDSSDIAHPEIEALFTSDEETGLVGAEALDTSSLRGRLMINIDSDAEGIFTVGCAGGVRIDSTLCFSKCKAEGEFYKVCVNGLTGGHSGTEINKGRINAIKVLAELLKEGQGVQIADIKGGNADNAIPRYAEAKVSLDSIEAIRDIVIPTLVGKYRAAEPSITVSIEELKEKEFCFSAADSLEILKFIDKTPTGVYKMSDELPGLPETSSNIGIIKTDGGRVTLSLSLRSAKNSEKAKLSAEVHRICNAFSAEVKEYGEYPAWEYKKESWLCDIMRRVYRNMYENNPKIITIHAGLECGIFAEKLEGLDCVSIGPDNFDIHTTSERLSISSTARVFEYLKAVLKNI